MCVRYFNCFINLSVIESRGGFVTLVEIGAYYSCGQVRKVACSERKRFRWGCGTSGNGEGCLLLRTLDLHTLILTPLSCFLS